MASLNLHGLRIKWNEITPMYDNLFKFLSLALFFFLCEILLFCRLYVRLNIQSVSHYHEAEGFSITLIIYLPNKYINYNYKV